MTAAPVFCSCGSTVRPTGPGLVEVCPHCDRPCRTAQGFCPRCQALDRAKRR